MARQKPPAAFIADMLARRELIALTGGGGKTSLMYALAHLLQREGGVVTTTTTHIRSPRVRESETVLLGAERWDDWRSALADGKHITVAESRSGIKLRGLPPESVDEIYRREIARYVVVEADGARRLPFKAYEEYEPVLPRETTLHIVVIGVEPFLHPVSEENTFRFGLLASRHGTLPGESLSPERIADLLDDPREYMRGAAPETRRLLLVNKCDTTDESRIAAIRDALSRRLQAYDLVLFASLREKILYDCAATERGRGGPARP